VETEFLIESLGFSLSCFVNVKNLPLLMFSTIFTENSNSLSFYILSSCNIKNLSRLPIDELIVLKLENLEPSGVCRPDLHVVSFTSRLDVPRLVVQSCSDSQRLLMEVPFLSTSTVCNFDDHVSVIDQIKISSAWQFRYNVKVSLNIESELLIELSLSWLTLPLINVDNVPLLVDSSMS
jgi:hypothetical protein